MPHETRQYERYVAMSKKDEVLAIRNAMFVIGDGMSLDSFMQGSIMAQTRMAVETATSEHQAHDILTKYFNIAVDALPIYWADKTVAMSEKGSAP